MSNNITCIGELLIDFICSDVNVDLIEGENFVKKAGGAPANVTAAISKLGGKASFIGKVGNDPFGKFLKKTLDDVNVDTSMLVLDDEHNTTLAFVSLKSDGERDFVFNRGADEYLTYDELDQDKLRDSKIVHFGSATGLLGGNLKETYLKAIKLCKEEGIFISFDPNYRGDLWKGRKEEFIDITKKCMEYADFVKVSDEELKIITGEEKLEDGVKGLHDLGAKIVTVTLGKDGTLVSNGIDMTTVKSIKIKSVDSTGAGDAFVGATLYRIAQLEAPKDLVKDFAKIKEIIAFSNKVGAITCTKLGAISSLPTLEEVESK
ncbi:carbohydrate kinase family protein [Caldisalinibacter kiritimatiensis]|uniref:Fructokinase n=1 Tax=Caldisalinibacter kiritimatiensis TaxID=1304284 RepID=R1AWU6_9FIRM|nr:carbohydrate kinase [Caldisalinibacter kiritimatiensis]EOD01117.1 Fructokinase [Caldisalinibacter kiritimatiensis]